MLKDILIIMLILLSIFLMFAVNYRLDKLEKMRDKYDGKYTCTETYEER